jgi:ATP-dependent DNA helicase RecQ
MLLNELNAAAILKQYYGYDKFRPLQEDIIRSILSRRDTLVLMPTGGGKSVCYQVPALLQEGICIVISPLIALMKDQVLALRTNGINAAALNSTLSPEESEQVMQDCRDGKTKLLYLSPERLLTMVSFLKTQLKISFIAVDEAHCISAWGHDFRPEYTQLHQLRALFPGVPFIALTATADKVTRKDIARQLGMEDPAVFIASFDRPNITLNVRKAVNGKAKTDEIIRFLKAREGEPGIIYCMSRKGTEEMAEKLRHEGFKASCYHAGLDTGIRDRVQNEFINDTTRIICATIAFGMGIDKSNVRWVIHSNMPKNMESYYQEIGRSGRDGYKAEALLFYNVGDLVFLTKLAQESKQSELNLARLERIRQFAEANHCRRKILLSYFGEVATANCNNCDSCRNPRPTMDGTRIALMALSAAVRCNQETGVNMLIDVLRGSTRSEVMVKNYHTIKTYGAGKEYSFRQWQEFLLQLINLGLFEIAPDEGYVLKVTDYGKEVLAGRGQVQLTIAEKETVAEKVGRRKRFFEEVEAKTLSVDEELFQELRKLRLVLSKAEKVPPYVIFSDATLREMSLVMPGTADELLEISGVGKRKMELYGDHFMHVIRKYAGIKEDRELEEESIRRIREKDLEKRGMYRLLLEEQRKNHSRSE